MQDSMQDRLRAGSSVAGYRLLRLLGEGAQSCVYLAQSLADNGLVALKIAAVGTGEKAAAMGRDFLLAARVAQELTHPDIVQVLGAGLQGPLAWLAMAAVPGTDLTRYTRAPRLLPEPVVLRLVARLARALAHAHRHGVVHRDIKPANVLVNWADGSVKLADFGLARVSGPSNTGTGVVMGTPAYMAPEQLAGAVPRPAADFYALGVLLFELLTGRLPHGGQTMGELLRQVAQDPAPDLLALKSGMPAELGHLLSALLAKAPSDRPVNGDAIAARLDSMSHTLGNPA